MTVRGAVRQAERGRWKRRIERTRGRVRRNERRGGSATECEEKRDRKQEDFSPRVSARARARTLADAKYAAE